MNFFKNRKSYKKYIYSVLITLLAGGLLVSFQNLTAPAPALQKFDMATSYLLKKRQNLKATATTTSTTLIPVVTTTMKVVTTTVKPVVTTTTTKLPQSCSFNGRTIGNGYSITAYYQPVASTCYKQSRTCSNGIMTGSYSYSSCSVQAGLATTTTTTLKPIVSTTTTVRAVTTTLRPVVTTTMPMTTTTLSGNCMFNGQMILNGSGTMAYAAPSVSAGRACSKQYRICSNGLLTGSYIYASCFSK